MPKPKPTRDASRDAASSQDFPHLPDRLIGIRECAALAGSSPTSIRRYVQSGDWPTPTLLGSRGAAAAKRERRESGEARGGSSAAHRWWLSEVMAFLRSEPKASREAE